MDDGSVSFGPTPPLALDPLPTEPSPPLSGGEAILGYFDRILAVFTASAERFLCFAGLPIPSCYSTDVRVSRSCKIERERRAG